MHTHTHTHTVTDSLFVRAVRLSTVGRCAFPVAGARIWSDVTSSPSLFTFKQRLFLPHIYSVVIVAAVCCSSHVKNMVD